MRARSSFETILNFSTVPAFEKFGRPIVRELENFHARVVQHECNHLIGMSYITRVKDFSRFGYTEVPFPGLDPSEDD
jgi:peptide deformylase